MKSIVFQSVTQASAHESRRITTSPAHHPSSERTAAVQRSVDRSARQLAQRQVVERIHHATQSVPKQAHGSGASGAPVQRYRHEQEQERIFKVSDDGNYRIPKDEPTCLQIRDGAVGPTPASFFMQTGSASQGWNVWEPRAVLGAPPHGGQYEDFCGPNDCGMYAEALATGNSQWGTTRSDIGHFFPNPTLTGYAATPDVGEFTYTFPPSVRPDRCNFHATSVVINAGDDRIASEADAGDAHRTRPHWKMYGKELKQTFHGKFRKTYGDHGVGDTFIEPTTTLFTPYPYGFSGASPTSPSGQSFSDFAVGVDDSNVLIFGQGQPRRQPPQQQMSDAWEEIFDGEDEVMSDTPQNAAQAHQTHQNSTDTGSPSQFLSFSDEIEGLSDLQLARRLFGDSYADLSQGHGAFEY